VIPRPIAIEHAGQLDEAQLLGDGLSWSALKPTCLLIEHLGPIDI
jgi:hypothetical protein